MRKFASMKRATLIAFVMCCVAVLAFPQQEIPEHNQYRAKVEAAKVRSVDFEKNAEARTFRTRLSQNLKAGVNFAGRYILATWGCGTGCISGAIIDGRTGKVYWPEELSAFGVGYTDATFPDRPLEFRKDSRLLVMRGIPGMNEAKDENAADKPSGDHYFEWKNNRLVQIKFVARPE